MEPQSLFDHAVETVLQHRKPSISHIQRQLKIDFQLAAELLEEMERIGIVSPMSSTGTRVIASGGGSTPFWRRLWGVGLHQPRTSAPDTTLSEEAIARLAAAAARIARSAARVRADGESAESEQDIDEAGDSYDSGPTEVDDTRGLPEIRAGERPPAVPQRRRNAPFPQRQRLRDARGNVYGYLDYRDDGANARLLLKDARYTILGYYDLTNDVTRDERGSLVGRGNQLMLLASKLRT